MFSLILLGIIAFYKDKFPPPLAYQHFQLKPPLQTPTAREPFTVFINHERYLIIPKFDYELSGMVVTYNNANGFLDIWHHDLWKDFINVRDLCVIWGANLSSGIYQYIHFSSDSWTCWVEWTDSQGNNFKSDGLSNNHILTENNQLKALLMQAEKGDIIHFKGVLAEYRNEQAHFVRGTSTRRDDTGNGACETVYIDDFTIVHKTNALLRQLYVVVKWLTVLFLIGYLILFVLTPKLKPKFGS